MKERRDGWWTGWHVKTKVRPLFPGFSHCACLPATARYLTPTSRRRPPVRKTLRLARGLHYSYKSFLVNIFLCSAAAVLPTFHFCLLSAPRAFHLVSSLTSRLISSNPPFPHHPSPPPIVSPGRRVPTYRHRINYLSTRTVTVLSARHHASPSFPYRRYHRRRRRRFVYSFSLFNFTDPLHASFIYENPS